MPDYVTMTALAAQLPGKFLIQALDDNQDGVADAAVFAEIQRAVREEIDARLGQRYDMAAFGQNLPSIVLLAGRVFATETLYQRRGVSDKQNPAAKQATELRKKLDAIGNGEQPLTPKAKPTNASGGVLVAEAKTVSASGRSS